jgi:hypothetical protein
MDFDGGVAGLIDDYEDGIITLEQFDEEMRDLKKEAKEFARGLAESSAVKA